MRNSSLVRLTSGKLGQKCHAHRDCHAYFCRDDATSMAATTTTMPQFCAAVNCSHLKSKQRHLSFFRFPRDRERYMFSCVFSNLNCNVLRNLCLAVAMGVGNLRTANWRTGNMRTNMRTRPLIGRDVTRVPRAVRKVPHGGRSSHCFVSRPNEPNCSIAERRCICIFMTTVFFGNCLCRLPKI